jgi:hypothetical protein
MFEQEQLSVTPGQAVVLYDDDLVLGGAVIDKPIAANPAHSNETGALHA